MTYPDDLASRSFRVLLAGAMIFLAFSTSKEQGGVVTFASPFLGAMILMLFPFSVGRLSKIDGQAFMLSLSYLLVMGIATLLSVDLLQSFVRFFFYLVAVFLFWTILVVYPRLGLTAEFLAKRILLSGFVLSAYFVGNFIYQCTEHNFVHVIYEREVGGLMSLPWGASNVIGQVLLLSMFAALFIQQKTKLVSFFMFFIFIGIVITMSRSVLLLSIPMLMMYFGLLRFSIAFSIFAAFVVYLVVTYAADLIDINAFYEFLERRTNSAEIVSGNDRFSLSYKKIEYFLTHPFEPIGFYSSINQFQSTAHNYWVTTLVEQSLFALIVSLLLFLLFLGRASMLGFRYGSGFFLIMLGLSVEDPQFTQQYTVMIWFVFLLVQIKYERELQLRDV